jgi:hypothetical protein
MIPAVQMPILRRFRIKAISLLTAFGIRIVLSEGCLTLFGDRSSQKTVIIKGDGTQQFIDNGVGIDLRFGKQRRIALNSRMCY